MLTAGDVRAAVEACPPSPDRDRTLAFLDSTANWRDDGAGHITASAAVLEPGAARTLLVFHRKLGRWLQPGGHVEAHDIDLPSAARREAVEETGIEGLVVERQPLHLDVHWVGTHHHYDIRYLVWTPEGAEPIPNQEVERFRWATPAELEHLDTDGSVRDLVKAALERVANR